MPADPEARVHLKVSLPEAHALCLNSAGWRKSFEPKKVTCKNCLRIMATGRYE